MTHRVNALDFGAANDGVEGSPCIGIQMRLP